MLLLAGVGLLPLTAAQAQFICAALSTNGDGAAVEKNVVGCGGYAEAFGVGALALGAGALAGGDYATAIGAYTYAGAEHATALGAFATANADSALALGDGASAVGVHSVALGKGSIASAENTVSVGSAEDPRRIVNVAGAVDANDAVNLQQLNGALDLAGADFKRSLEEIIDYVDTAIENLNNNSGDSGDH